jgi:hypothetical protein
MESALQIQTKKIYSEMIMYRTVAKNFLLNKEERKD